MLGKSADRNSRHHARNGVTPGAALQGGMKEKTMDAKIYSAFRYTRHIARAYRAGIRRQKAASQQRSEEVEVITRELHGVLDWWAAQGLACVYDRAVSPTWDRHP